MTEQPLCRDCQTACLSALSSLNGRHTIAASECIVLIHRHGGRVVKFLARFLAAAFMSLGAVAGADEPQLEAPQLATRSASDAIPVAEKYVFFNRVVTSGGRVLCSSGSRYRLLRGHDLSSDLWPLQTVVTLAEIYCLLPHRVGLVDVVVLFGSPVNDEARVGEIERCRVVPSGRTAAAVAVLTQNLGGILKPSMPRSRTARRDAQL